MKLTLHIIKTIVKREFLSFLFSPVAYIFVTAFLIMNLFFNFKYAQWLNNNELSLSTFFSIHPYLYFFFIPALSMRVWADEENTGTIELLLTFPVKIWHCVVGKFLAASLFLALTLSLTFPIIFTNYYLGSPDGGVIFSQYLASLFIGGVFIAICSICSVLSSNQVLSFLFSIIILLIFTLIGIPQSLEFLNSYCSSEWIETISFFSILSHYQNLQRGSLDGRDLIYIFSLIFCALVMSNIIIRSRKAAHKWNKQLTVGAGAILLFIFIIINNMSKTINWRLDLTSHNSYSLSEVTKNIVKNLKSPINFTLFYSKNNSKIPLVQKAFFRQLEDRLLSYQQYSKYISYELIDPQEEGKNLEQIEGITAIEYGEQSYYCSLKVFAGDKQILFDKLTPEQEVNLEYNLTDVIKRQLIKTPVGVITQLPISGLPMDPSQGRYSPRPPWKFINSIKDGYELYSIPQPITNIPLELKALIIIHPTQLSLQTIYAIEQYLLAGGKAMIYMDPICMVSSLNKAIGVQNIPNSSKLLGLLKNWGIYFSDKKVIQDSKLATIYQKNLSNSILTLSSQLFNRENIITKNLKKMVLPYAGSFEIKPPPYELKSEPLIYPPIDGLLVNRQDAFNASNTLGAKNTFPLAVLVKGKFESSFFAIDKYVKNNPNHIQKSAKEMKVILLSDADNLYDLFNYEKSKVTGQYVQTSNNVDFIANSLDYLCDNEFRIPLRDKIQKVKQFDKLNDKKRQIDIERNKEILAIQKQSYPIIKEINKLFIKRQNQQNFTYQDEIEIEKLLKEKTKFDKKIEEKLLQAEQKFSIIKNNIFLVNIFLVPIIISLLSLLLYLNKKIKQRK